MTFLLDVNALIALIWAAHADHKRAVNWRAGKTIGLCPISELGFIRISTQPAAFNLPMADARKALADFIKDEMPEFLPADIRALDGDPAPGPVKATDFYLANLAGKHGWKLATFDNGIRHPAVEVIP